MEEKSRAVRSVESEETFNDYEFSPVPDEKKNTWKAQVFVWLGVGFCLTAFTLGGQIALGLLAHCRGSACGRHHFDSGGCPGGCHRCPERTFLDCFL